MFVSGTSRYEAQDVLSRDAVVDVSGSAFALVNVRESLSGQVTGAGIVRDLGNPIVSVTVSGAGRVAPQ